ncbi:hypothetical protein PRNP1_007892 [Phytophthora ramorum]
MLDKLEEWLTPKMVGHGWYNDHHIVMPIMKDWVPNCQFEVMMNGSERKVAVVTISPVPAEGELTVLYCT